MNLKLIVSIGLIAIAFGSSFTIIRVGAASELDLPSNLVLMEVFNGTGTYFETHLSNIPLRYDVANGTYPGWCVDITAPMARSPAIHEVVLYSSTNPPGKLATQRWDMVNYILNHKQGEMADIQQAIWYFVNMVGNYSPSRVGAMTIVNDALANGNGFVPQSGDIMAVICVPVVLLPEPLFVQISIIELQDPVIPEFPSFLIAPLFMIATLSVAAAVKTRHKTQAVPKKTRSNICRMLDQA
jgi:hypothetical protein